ncbi:helix-turn-helix transcriptional regulator [Listeria booriae]|uniref:helix-turn-helix transcriptional regulator n=1 Tax=Listeria booriae TaxID=1552123 RepID=UPI0016245449|nr:helix-turn-helix transcriptional regulator [Listeria booriae]MBC1290583.1 helix-turn-helix transcriptional regulator [Listeria booriae]
MRENLKRERLKKNMSQKEVAINLSLSEITVRKLEKGDRNPSLATAKNFAILYNKKLEYLFPDIFLVNNDTKRIQHVERISN